MTNKTVFELATRGSLRKTASLAAGNGYRLVATKGQGHKKVERTLGLTDIRLSVEAYNSGLLFMDELLELVARYHSQNTGKVILSKFADKGSSATKVVYHVQ